MTRHIGREIVQVAITCEDVCNNNYFQIFLTDAETKQLNDMLWQLETDSKIRDYKILDGEK